MTADEAEETVIDATMAMASREGVHDKDTGELWTREAEEDSVRKRMKSVLDRLQKEHWAAVDAGNIEPDTPPSWLWAGESETWFAICCEGIRPEVTRNGSKYYVRRPPYSKAKPTNMDSPPTIPDAGTESLGEASKPEKPRRQVLRKPHLKDTTIGWWKPVDPATFPVREWLYGKHYQRGVVSGTIAPGGSGKTSLCMVEAIAMATCRNLLGEQPVERVRVWYHNAEDTQVEVERRVLAICQKYGIPQEELDGWFVATSCELFDLHVANGFEVKVDAQLVAALTDKIRRMEIDVAIFDPLVNLHTVNEQDNGKMNLVIGIFRAIAQGENCGIEIEQHTRKHPAGSDGDFRGDDARGASAVRDAFRAQRVLNHMSQKEAAELGIPDHERTLYVRVDVGKANNSRPGPVVWRRLTNVTLANGDDVGVIEQWAHPGEGGKPSEAQAEAERTADAVFMQLLRKLRDAGRAVGQAVNSPYYAPKVFAAEKEAKLAKLSRAHFSSAMRRLFDRGEIRVSVDRGADRHGREVIEPTT
jgi:RecA-family ATPase